MHIKIPSAEISSVESESIEDSDFNGFEIIRD